MGADPPEIGSGGKENNVELIIRFHRTKSGVCNDVVIPLKGPDVDVARRLWPTMLCYVKPCCEGTLSAKTL